MSENKGKKHSKMEKEKGEHRNKIPFKYCVKIEVLICLDSTLIDSEKDKQNFKRMLGQNVTGECFILLTLEHKTLPYSTV